MKILPSVVMPFAVSCGILSVFGGEDAAFHARFDGTLAVNGAEPVRASNLTFTAGIEGKAVRIPVNGWLEYAFDPAYLKDDAGSLVFWVKTDWTYSGGCEYRDHALTEDGKWGPLSASKTNRTLFKLGDWRGIRYTTGSKFSGTYVEAWGGAGIRGRVLANEWHQYAVTYDQTSGRYRYYIDGNLLEDRSFPKPVKGIFSKTFTVGCGGVLGGFLGPALGPRLGLEGAMDELRLYPRELRSAEIMADYVRHIPFMNSRICRPPRTRARRRIAARSACGTRIPRWTRSSSSTTRSTTGTPTSSSGV